MTPWEFLGISRRPGPVAGVGATLSGTLLLASTAAAVPPPAVPPPAIPAPSVEARILNATNPTAGVVVLAQIAGVVATQEGHPLPGAVVSVMATDQGDHLDTEAKFAVTDEQGRFEVSETTPGLYSLRAYLTGFLPSPPAQVLVRSGASFADTLLIQMAATVAEPGSGSLSELRWLLQRGRRNVLKERRASLDFEETWGGEWAEQKSRLAALAALEGEFGFFAASGSSLGLPESSAVDSGIAYTRFELPSTARGRWAAEARLMESALASWAANLSYQMEEFDGHQFSAGIGYQRHVYGDAPDYRPAGAPILNASLLDEPQAAWDGAAYIADDFSLGPASLSTGLTYRRFSYLTGHRGFAPRAVLEYEAGEDWTLIGGMAVRVDGPIGEDSALLSRVAHDDLFALDPSWFRSQAAQRSTRYQAGVQYQASPNAVIAARLFRENTNDQLLRSFEAGPIAGGRFDVSNAGDYAAQGFAMDWVRDLAPVTRRLDLGGRLSWLVATVRNPADAALGGEAEAITVGLLLPVEGSATVHDLSAEVAARLRPSGTRISAAYRLISHPGLTAVAAAQTGAENADERTARFDVELVQLIPFADWSGTEWELSLAVRDLFFRDLLGRSLLDEIAVAHAPRRIVGGLAVRF